MTSTPFVAASFAGQTAGTLLSAYVPQSGDVNAVFSKLHGNSNLAFGSANDLNATSGGADAFYGAGGVLSSSQTQMDVQVDLRASSIGDYVDLAGIVFGDDGTGQNYLEIRINEGTVFTPNGVAVYNVVNNGGNNTIIAQSAQTLTAGSVYTMLGQIRGTPGSYTLDVYFGLKGSTLAHIITALAIPSLVMPGRYVGVVQTFYLTSSGSTAQTDSTGIHALNFASSTYTAGGTSALAAGMVSVATTGTGTATVSTTAASGGTAPYSYQFQRAPVTGGTVGTYANVGTAGTSLTYNDTGTSGNTYSYQVVVTDSAGTPATATSGAFSYTYSTPSFSLATAPTSLSLSQGTSLTAVVTSTATGGYALAETLSLSGLPAGVTGSFSPSSITGSGTSTLTLTAAGNANTGTSTVTVTGTDTNGLTKTVTLALTVTAPLSGVTLDTVNNNVLALINAVNAAANRNTFS